MPIRFSCPKCHARLSVADDKAGSKAPCPQCRQRLEVPRPPENKTLLGELESAPNPTVLGELIPESPALGPVTFDPAPPPSPAPPPPPLPPRHDAFDFHASGHDDGYADDYDYRPPPRRNSGTGVVAMVLGIVGLVSFPLLGPVAIILAHQALREDRNDGMAKAGLILGWIDTALLLFGCGIVILYFIVIAALIGGTRMSVPG